MIPDYTSYVVGYRFWKLYKGVLRSIWHDDVPWPFREIYRPADFPGINAYFSEEKVVWNMDTWRKWMEWTPYPYPGRPYYARPEAVLGGKVALWGEVVQHELGYMSSIAYPLSINHFFPYFPLRSAEENMDLIRINYGIEVNVDESDWKRD